MKCPNCGNDVSEDSDFCSNCGKSIRKRKIYPLTAGILAIIGSCLTFFIGILLLIIASIEVQERQFNYSHGLNTAPPFPTYFLLIGIFAVVTFAFGLFAGLAAVNRKYVTPAIFGLSLLTASGILISLPINSSATWELGLPIILLSVLSTVFVVISKSEFHRSAPHR